jgi:hypothetical protein
LQKFKNGFCIGSLAVIGSGIGRVQGGHARSGLPVAVLVLLVVLLVWLLVLF